MGYMVCSIFKCRNIAHGEHDATGNNLCRKCFTAYNLGIEQYKQALIRGAHTFPYKVGGEAWEKS